MRTGKDLIAKGLIEIGHTNHASAPNFPQQLSVKSGKRRGVKGVFFDITIDVWRVEKPGLSNSSVSFYRAYDFTPYGATVAALGQHLACSCRLIKHAGKIQCLLDIAIKVEILPGQRATSGKGIDCSPSEPSL